MVITIRFTDWLLFFFVFLCWGIDHWFTTYGLKMLSDSHKIEFISHTMECFAMITVFIATFYIVFKLFHYSFFFGISGLIFTSSIPIMSYLWNSFLMTNQLFFASLLAFFVLLLTVIGAIIICRLNIKFLFPAIPLLFWRILLLLMNVACLA